MSSLNDGFELDDELVANKEKSEDKEIKSVSPSDFSDIIFNNVTPGEVPELSDDASVIAVVNKTEDLQDLKTNILNAGGMNKRFALEAECLIPGFINEASPVTFYTEFTSKTKYKVAIEAIEAEQKSLVKRIWDLLVKLFKNSIAWLEEFVNKIKKLLVDPTDIQKFFSSNNTLDILEKVQTNTSDPDRVVQKVAPYISKHRTISQAAANSRVTHSLNLCKHKVESLYFVINKHRGTRSIVSNNSIVSALVKIGVSSDDIVSEYGEINKSWLEKALNDKNNSTRNVERAISQIHAPAIKRGIPTFEKYQVQAETQMNLSGGAHTPDNTSMKSICTTLAKVFKTDDVSHYQETTKRAIEKLKKLRESALAFADDPTLLQTVNNGKSNVQITDVIGTLYRELRGLMGTLSLANSVFEGWTYLFKEMSAIIETYNRSMSQDISGMPDDDRKMLQKYFGLEVT
jgi:hypothetical protein